MIVFGDEQVVAERCNNNPKEFVALLETVLTNEQQSMIETALFPEPTRSERRTALHEVHLMLIRAGVPTDDLAVNALDTEIDTIELEVA